MKRSQLLHPEAGMGEEERLLASVPNNLPNAHAHFNETELQEMGKVGPSSFCPHLVLLPSPDLGFVPITLLTFPFPRLCNLASDGSLCTASPSSEGPGLRGEGKPL